MIISRVEVPSCYPTRILLARPRLPLRRELPIPSSVWRQCGWRKLRQSGV